MKNIRIFAFIGLLLLALPMQAQELNVDNQWKFSIGDDAQWALPKFDDSSWKTISSVYPWESQGYVDYDGFGWYRKQIIISASEAGQIKKYGGLMIKYNNVDDADELYFNGYKIGSTGGMPPHYESKYGVLRKYIVPAQYIKGGQANLLAVRTYDGGGGGGIVSDKITVRSISGTDKVKFTYNFPAKEWVFMQGDPQLVNVSITNTLGERLKCNVVLKITTDDYKPVDSISVSVALAKGAELNKEIPFQLPAPGFYRVSLYLEKNGIAGDVQKINIGYEPEKVISVPDAKADLESFWKQSLADLAKTAPDFRMTLIPERSTGAKNIYHVEMMSYMNTKIEGYYAAPKAEGKYPAIAVYMGYGSEPYFPHTDGNPGFCEFILSVRGQGIQKAKSAYGNWDTWGLADRDTYYYRGAFLDLVRAVDFLVSRPEVNAEQIVAEGGSQGGAFTLAACALDHRIKAAAPTIPFLSDYRDYFRIVSWPRSDFETYLAQHPDANWEKVYNVLSYFDIKNLAGWIQCPVFMAAGLQDEVCPNHTNFAGFNNIKSEKKWVIYHDQGHGTPNEWYQLRMDFFKEKLGIK